MARFEHLPIYKKSFDLLIWTEGVVRGFSRYNKYTLGSDLRNQVRLVLKTIVEANNSAAPVAFVGPSPGVAGNVMQRKLARLYVPAAA